MCSGSAPGAAPGLQVQHPPGPDQACRLNQRLHQNVKITCKCKLTNVMAIAMPAGNELVISALLYRMSKKYRSF